MDLRSVGNGKSKQVSSMAAYASLVILARNIDPVHGDLNHIHHDLDFKPLYGTVVQLLAIMDNCPGDKLSEDFEARIRDYANRANNIIETHFLQILDTRSEGECVTLPELHELTYEAACLVVLGGDAVIDDPNMQMKSSSSSSSSSVYTSGGATRKVRLYSDVAKLKEKLYHGSSQREVIPIVGMGGTGKTTIASVLFEDPYSATRFDRRAWITVSQNYDKRTLLSQILQSLKASPDEMRGDLGTKVHQTLKWRRYLVVIDDAWSEKLWDDIRIFLPDNGNGSRILLTTRLENVANYVVSSNEDGNESYIHRAELMDLDKSWSLFKDTVFGQDGDCPVELEGIGKSIVKDCRGLPLAIVVIAGVLSSTNNKKDLWKKTAADVSSAINISSSDGVAKVLSLSYINLPHHLKPCFLYLACFPKGFQINVSRLIMLWAAEGFLKLSKSHRSKDEVAYEYLEDLVKKNLVLVSETEYNGKIQVCHLHDMIRDLCVETSTKENFGILVNDTYSTQNKNQIRFSIDCNNRQMWSFFDDLMVQHLPAAHVRSVPYIRGGFMFNVGLYEHLSRFRLLRVLDMESTYLGWFPKEICQLFLLRYLAIKIIDLKVPSSIKELKNLEVLSLKGTDVKLPLEIWEMSKLRHLIAVAGMRLPDPPIGTRSSSSSSYLENLQSLIGVRHMKCTEQVLHMIPNLKLLEISYDTIKDSNRNFFQNLVHLAKLETLRIFCVVIPSVWMEIQLPHSLKELTLCYFQWSELGRVVGSLPNLEVMILQTIFWRSHGIWEVKEGEFSKLKVLVISRSYLIIWKYDGETGSIFPNLERLELRGFDDLIEFPSCIGEIETLKVITVDDSSKLLVKWATEVKKEQEYYENEYPQVIIEKRTLKVSRVSNISLARFTNKSLLLSTLISIRVSISLDASWQLLKQAEMLKISEKYI